MASSEAETDVRRTLKFIGRLAVRLQSGGDTSFSEEALQKALKDAVSAVPEGVVKQTLVSNPDRFARALVDRVSSLGGVNEVKDLAPLQEKDVDALLSRDLLSESDYESAVSALVSQSGEEKETEKWRQLAWKIVTARDAVSDTVIAALVRIETALGRKKVVVENADVGREATSEAAVLEEVASSLFLRSAFLPTKSRLLLLPPFVSLLEDAVRSLARLENARSQAKRLEKMTRSLLAVHNSHLRHSEGGTGRTGALLYVTLVVTKYLVLKKGDRLGESALEKVRQTAMQAQAVSTVEERGAVVNILSLEEETVISSLPEEGPYAVRGALYEAALRSVPFEEVDASQDAWLGRIALARKAAKMFRANGDRSRATAISKAVLKYEVPANLPAVSTPRREKLLQFIPSEGLLNDPRGLTAWLANSADDKAFAAVRDALLSEEITSTSSLEAAKPDRGTGPQQEAGDEEAEPLFYIDRTGGSVDPAEEAMIAAVETMRLAASNEQLAGEKDETEMSDYTEDESAKPTNGQQLKKDKSKRLKGPGKKRKKKGQDEGGISSEVSDKSDASGESGSSDSEMDEDEFIARMPSRPLDEPSDSEPEPSKEKKKPRAPPKRISIAVEPSTAEKVKVDESAEAAQASSADEEERLDEKTDELLGENGLPKIAVKKPGSGVSFEEREELSPLHTRSGRSVASPGPSSVSKKGLRGLGKKKEALSSVSELAGEGGKEAVKIEGGDVQRSGLKTPGKKGGAGRMDLEEQVSEPKSKIKVVPTTAKKGKKLAEKTGDEDYVSPLHTRSGKALVMPSTVKKTAMKKRGAVDKLADKVEEDISPLHTRSGKVIVATPATVKNTSAPQTLASSSKRLRKV